ncbi:MAG: DUF2813 domain-containing protein [Elainellaceae cyanobacterium]
MKLRRLQISNFRGIRELELFLDDLVVLIGENNSGKTAILDALRLCLRDLSSRRRVVFNPFDFHLVDENATPTSTNPIQIIFTFSEDAEGEWDSTLVGRLNRQKILQIDDEGKGHVVLAVTCTYDAATRDFAQNWDFHTLDNQPLPGVADSALTTLQREVVYFYLSALRDASKHFDAKGPFWRPFLRDSELSDEKKEEIEQKLKEVNDLVIASHTSFEEACNRLRSVQDVVPMASGDVVSIEAVPGRMFDMLAKAQVFLATSTGAKVPIERHGEGTQSLAVLTLFKAFLDTWPNGFPIIGLEEPEAHLHPSAIRSLWKIVSDFPGQKIISTHSGDLLSEIPASAIRRLCRTQEGTRISSLKSSTLTPDDERKFNFHVRYARGELLFARCWLLVEGETEVTLLPEVARYLGINLENAGVRCVPHRHASIELFLKVARDLGIACCVLADNDDQGAKDQECAHRYLEPKMINHTLHVMSESDIECHLCSAGFGQVYESYLSPQTWSRVMASRNEPEYWPQVLTAIKKSKSFAKPEAALRVVDLIHNETISVPPLLESVVKASVNLSGGL